MRETGEALQQLGQAMQGCGCLLTLVFTVPMICFLIYLFGGV